MPAFVVQNIYRAEIVPQAQKKQVCKT